MGTHVEKDSSLTPSCPDKKQVFGSALSQVIYAYQAAWFLNSTVLTQRHVWLITPSACLVKLLDITVCVIVNKTSAHLAIAWDISEEVFFFSKRSVWLSY